MEAQSQAEEGFDGRRSQYVCGNRKVGGSYKVVTGTKGILLLPQQKLLLTLSDNAKRRREDGEFRDQRGRPAHQAQRGYGSLMIAVTPRELRDQVPKL